MTLSSPTAAGISLRELLGPDGRAPNLRVTSCTSDWRQVRPGDVFVALVGADEDGHDGAVEAARRGAVAVICERQLPIFNVPLCIVPCSRAVYGRLCQALMGNPSSLLKVIGVTGTHGKTTVARLLASILRQAGASVGTLDSFGYWDDWHDRPPLGGPLTPPALAESLASMVACGASHAVIEFGSRELCASVACGVTLDAVCMTHIGRRHLDWHGSIENYRRAKQQVFEYLPVDGVAILNADDPVSVRMLCELNQPVLTFGLRKRAEVTAQIVEQFANELTFVLSAGDESAGVRTAMVGDHHVYNCLAAATTALAYGIDLTVVARGLEAVDRLPGRMERVIGGQDFAVFVDAANSPDALRAALGAAQRVNRGRLICVFSALGKQEAGEWPAMGRVVGAMADAAAVTTGGIGGNADRTCRQLLSGFADRQRGRIINDRAEAIAWALETARAGDTIVIAGMGERVHTLINGHATPLNDGDIVRNLLNEALIGQSHRLAA